MLQGRQSTEERIQALVKNEVQLTEDLAEIRKAITEITSRHGTTDLTRLFNMQMMALSEIESTFRSTRMDLIMAESSVADLDDVSHLNEEEVARFDPLMMSYIQKREQLESDLVLWRARYTDEMPGRTQIESEYADTQRRIEARLREVASSGQLALAGRSGGSGSVGPRALDVLRERAQRVRELYDRDRKVTLQIGMDDLRVKTLTSEADLVQGRLEEVKGRIDQLRVESSVIGKINVISEGDRPLTPIADRRRAMALAGSLGGAGLAVASIIGWGLLERRIRYSDEVSRHIGIPLFGVVPEIDTDSTQAYPTESVVREIRWALELRGQEHSQGLQTVAVIGDSTNGGVSSISLALGVSFAASGRSTALLDLGAGEARLRSILASNEEPAPDDDTAALLELPTGIRNLTLVDPRNATEVDDLPLARIQNLLDELRERFDVILIDCGSLDSSQGFLPACSIADGSLLVCARGVKTASIEKAVARLRGCRARILGAVFNRACPDDLPPHARSSAPVQSELRDKNLHRLGPIVATMVHGQHVENQ
jgi:Mrp family chromosome partitioning ATPase